MAGARPDGDLEPSVCIVLFTKPAVAGRVKTRLHQGHPREPYALTLEDAARLHHAFLEDVLLRLQAQISTGKTRRVSVEIAWALDGSEDRDAPRGVAEFESRWGDWRGADFVDRAAVPSRLQRGADLGERLYNGLRAAGERSDVVVAVGSDHPELRESQVIEAIDQTLGDGAAERGRIVFIPAQDGGFVLMACRSESLSRGLFESVDWSTSAVMSQCRERALTEALEVVELEAAHDCDDPNSLKALTERLARCPGLCPRTEEFLRRAGLLEHAT